MNILKLQGLDGRLFDLVTPLVMNPAVLRQNNNYPFKTTRNHVWYIAMDEQRVLGFMPVKMTLTNNCIDNYYISGDNSSVIEMLLDRIIHDFSSDGSLVDRKNATWRLFNEEFYPLCRVEEVCQDALS